MAELIAIAALNLATEIMKSVNFYNANLTTTQAQQTVQELFQVLHLLTPMFPKPPATP